MARMRESIYKFDPDDAHRFAAERGDGTWVKGDELHFKICPYCHGNAGKDKKTFAINLRTGQFKCMRASCGAHGNMITLARDFNFSLGTSVDEYFNSRKRYRDLTRYPRPVVRTPAVEYMESRGISKAVTEAYGITAQKGQDNIIVFPFYDEQGKLQFVKYRKADFQKGRDRNKEWSEANCKPILFGMDHCNPEDGALVLTEGQIDSLSVTEAGIKNAVSVPTGANGFTWVPYCWDFLGKFDTLIVFGDHENGRITLLDEMRTRFHGTVKHVRPEDYLGCKDANELLVKYGKQAVRDAVEHAEPVRNPRIKKLSEVVKKDAQDLEAIDTGIAQLNRTLGGLFYGQLVILAGERGLGKSTLGSQIITQAARQGVPSFCYSGELPEWFFQEWFDRQCAGSDYINPVVSPLGYTNYTVDGLCAEQIHAWYDDIVYIYDNSIVKEDEGEEIIKTLENAIKQYGCRILMIDNLMTAISDDLRNDLYRQQSAFVRALANMAKQYGVIVLLVVHPRKAQGSSDFKNDDVAGSSNIINLADVVLRYAEPKEDDERRPDRILQITKNRKGGGLNFEGIALWYDEPSKRISETKGKFDWKMGWEQSLESGDGFLSLPDDADEAPW